MSEENDRFFGQPVPRPAPGHAGTGNANYLEEEPSDGLTDFEIKPVIPRQYWYNLRTGQVEEGQLSSWTQRMGPYATPEEAHAALENARKRDEAWQMADDEWYGREHEADD